jgi:hypothetical protein
MPWIIKALFIVAKSRRGRKLLFSAGLTAVELAQREDARKLYARARTRIRAAQARR